MIIYPLFSIQLGDAFCDEPVVCVRCHVLTDDLCSDFAGKVSYLSLQIFESVLAFSFDLLGSLVLGLLNSCMCFVNLCLRLYFGFLDCLVYDLLCSDFCVTELSFIAFFQLFSICSVVCGRIQIILMCCLRSSSTLMIGL